MIILKEIFQNILLGIPAFKQLVWKWHTTGINNDPDKVSDLWEQIIAASSIKGKLVLEIGPGRTDALLYLAQKASAKGVFALDVYPYLNNKILLNEGVEYKIYDGKLMPFENCSIDLIWSNDTFEHLMYPEKTVSELARILKKDGLAIINIDLSDHYSQGKSEKMLFNCLKYPDWLWKIMASNRSAYINRLRCSDWLTLFKNSDLTILSQKTTQSEVIKQLIRKNELPYLQSYSEIHAITNYLSITIKN